MNRKNLPLFLMLTAGAVTSMIKWTLDFFELQNEEKRKEEGEDIEEEPVEPEDSEDAAENPEDEPEN